MADLPYTVRLAKKPTERRMADLREWCKRTFAPEDYAIDGHAFSFRAAGMAGRFRDACRAWGVETD